MSIIIIRNVKSLEQLDDFVFCLYYSTIQFIHLFIIACVYFVHSTFAQHQSDVIRMTYKKKGKFVGPIYEIETVIT